MQDDDPLAKELKEFAKNAVSTLNMHGNSFITNSTSDDITDPVGKAIDNISFNQALF